jgi:hypothetical protein
MLAFQAKGKAFRAIFPRPRLARSPLEWPPPPDTEIVELEHDIRPEQVLETLERDTGQARGG